LLKEKFLVLSSCGSKTAAMPATQTRVYGFVMNSNTAKTRCRFIKTASSVCFTAIVCACTIYDVI